MLGSLRFITAHFTNFNIQRTFDTAIWTKKEAGRVRPPLDLFSSKGMATMYTDVQVNQFHCAFVEGLRHRTASQIDSIFVTFSE